MEFIRNSPYGKKHGLESFENLIAHLEHRSGSSYQGIGGLFSKISKDAQKLYNFSGRNWGGGRVQPSQYDSKVLHVIFPDTVLSYEQMLSLQIAELYIENEYGIRLLISVTEVVK